MRIVKMVWDYFGITQPVWIRMLHLATIFLVLIQLVTSNFVDIGDVYRSGGGAVFGAGAWSHILPGLLFLGIMLLFTVTELIRRGLKYFFAYLWGDFSQLTADVKTLIHRQLPEAAPGGLSAVVQGLGMGAVGLTLLSGVLWLFLTRAGSGMAHSMIEIHEALTGLVIAYLIGHGGMGLLHMVLWIRTAKK